MMSKTTLDGLNIQQEQKQQEELIQKVLSKAKELGASSAEVSASKSSGVSVRSRLKAIETLQFKRGCDLGITVYFGQKQGRASTSDLRDDAVEACIRSAIDIARFTAEDPHAGLADSSRMQTQFPDLKLDYPASISTEDAIDAAISCEAAGLDHDGRIENSDGASFASYRGIKSYGNSHGFLASSAGTQHSMSCTLIAKDGDQMKRNGWYTVGRELSDLDEATHVGEAAAKETLKELGARKMKTCKLPVIFSAEIASELLGHFFSAISGGSLYRKSSYLLDRINTQVFPKHISIIERPQKIKGLASASFDSEGVATYEHDIVRNGELKSYILSSYSARRLGLMSTGNAGGLRNTEVSYTDKDLDGLLKQMGTGILVTSVMGQGVNIVTGDYSRGADGFWVENGEIKYPVHEFTIAGNLNDMFLNIVNVANDLDARSSTLTGSILIEEMMIAGDG